jgi:rhomboid protease GluP
VAADDDPPPPDAPREAEVTPWFAPRPPPPEPRVDFGRAMHEATPRVRATWWLLAANVAVFLWMTTTRGVDPRDPSVEELLANGANSAALVLDGGQWWRLFTCTFVHVGALHLAVNMYALYVLGPFVERLFGNLGFAAIWLVSGLVGSLSSIAVHPQAEASAGASGSLFGVLGALAGYLVRERRTMPEPIRRGLTRSLIRTGGINLLIGALVPMIDMAAHGGGAVAGFLAGLALARPLTDAGVRGRGVRALLATAAGVLLCAVVLVALTPLRAR